MKRNVGKMKASCCYGCQACSNICPQGCIKMTEDKKGFLIPEVEEAKCINCGLCIKICPAKRQSSAASRTSIYAANIKDYDIRKKSTSGGVFYALAEYVIAQGGYVYGAAFDENYNVVHICAKNLDDVKRCMKSKYVQSNMDKVYEQIAKQSRTRLVLFTGTPCQAAAVSRYPNINVNNLILVDVVCHGVPSPKLWRKYLWEKEKEYGHIISIKTRDKTVHGCLNSETVLRFSEGKEYRKVLDKDDYMRAFMRGYSLRDTCYNCNYKGRRHVSDLTMGDFVSAAKYVKNADEFIGNSILIVNTDKGSEIIKRIKERLETHRIYSKKPLLEDWTWGLSFTDRRQSDFFYESCFEQNYSIYRSTQKTKIYLNKKDNLEQRESIKEKLSRYKNKLKQIYYQQYFKL